MDSCEVLQEKKFWRVKKKAQLEACAVDLSKVRSEKGKILLLDLDECLIHSKFTDIYQSKGDAIPVS